MTPINLSTPVYDGAIYGISFFNGRLLSGEDMAAEQQANRAGRRLLGKALGAGVAYGLEVIRTVGAADTDPYVTVQPGLALNEDGQTLLLEKPVDISLRYLEAAVTTVFTGFAVCQDERTSFAQAQPSPFTNTGDRMYVLLISSAEVSVGRAPVSGLGNIDAGCNARYNVEAVTFRLLPLGLHDNDYKPLHKLRSHVAAACIVTPNAARDPFGALPQSDGLLDKLRVAADNEKRLKSCDVPLAAIYLEASGRVRFIDLWSVRRRITTRYTDARWGVLSSDRVVTEGEARYMQFQTHIHELLTNQQQEAFPGQPSNPNQIAADQRFVALPPAGILPIVGANSPGGFNWQTFFGAHAPEYPDTTDSTMLPGLLRASFGQQPLMVGDLDDGPLRLYYIHENKAAVEAGDVAQLALVFARRSLPYVGVARFGEAAWEANRFS
jgi:hypothetical protein